MLQLSQDAVRIGDSRNIKGSAPQPNMYEKLVGVHQPAANLMDGQAQAQAQTQTVAMNLLPVPSLSAAAVQVEEAQCCCRSW